VARGRALIAACLGAGLLVTPEPAVADIAEGPAPASAPAEAPDLGSVMAGLARSGGVRARFVERKHLALLRAPLESGGTLYFDPPDRLARHVDRPGPAALAVSGDDVVMRDATGETRLSLRESEVARGLVRGIAVVLRGDVETLRARYRVELRPAPPGWVLELEPRDARLGRLVESLVVHGAGAQIRRIVVHEEGGDRTETVFTEVETGVRFAPDERGRLFLLEGPPAGRDD